MEEAAVAIEMLEHKLENQQHVHEEEVKEMEEKLLKYENDSIVQKEDSINNNVASSGTYNFEQVW